MNNDIFQMVDTLMEHQLYIHGQANTLDEMISYRIGYIECVDDLRRST